MKLAMHQDKEQLISRGFVGFKAVWQLDEEQWLSVPHEPGIYAILLPEVSPATFLSESRGGHFKGKDPTVPVSDLTSKWVPNATLLYVGKAGPSKGRHLNTRLRELVNSAAGDPVAHWGGRYLWQLADAHVHQVAWKPTPQQDPDEAKAELLTWFKGQYGRNPFANIR